MNTLDVYSMNVMPWAIAEFLGCSPKDTEKVEEERTIFLNFIKKAVESGEEFSSQETAWNFYKEKIIIYERPEDFEHMDFDLLDDDEISWMDEIDEILDRSIRVGNYTEFGGQQ